MTGKKQKYSSLQPQSPDVKFGSDAVAGLIKKAAPGSDILLADANHGNLDIRRTASSPQVDAALREHGVGTKYVEMPREYQDQVNALEQSPDAGRDRFVKQQTKTYAPLHTDTATHAKMSADAVANAAKNGLHTAYIDTVNTDNIDVCLKSKYTALAEGGSVYFQAVKQILIDKQPPLPSDTVPPATLADIARGDAAIVACRISTDPRRADEVAKLRTQDQPIAGVFGNFHYTKDSGYRYGAPNLYDLSHKDRPHVSILITDGTNNNTSYDTRSQFDAVVDIKGKTVTVNHPEKFPNGSETKADQEQKSHTDLKKENSSATANAANEGKAPSETTIPTNSATEQMSRTRHDAKRPAMNLP